MFLSPRVFLICAGALLILWVLFSGGRGMREEESKPGPDAQGESGSLDEEIESPQERQSLKK